MFDFLLTKEFWMEVIIGTSIGIVVGGILVQIIQFKKDAQKMEELKQENKELKVEISRLNKILNNQLTPDMDKSIDEAVSEEMLNTQDISQENDEPSMSR